MNVMGGLYHRESPRLAPSNLRMSQAKCVGDDRDRAEGHCRTGENRTQQKPEEGIKDASRDGNSDGVVCKGKKQILANVAHGGAAEFAGARDTAQIAAKQRDPGA